MATHVTPTTRSKEHHVGVGLRFWSAFKDGDIDSCVELMHPEVEWHPTPEPEQVDVVRGRDDVRIALTTLHDRFADGMQVQPEDGRQIGDHVLMVTMLSGRNAFTQQSINSRECWVVSIRDDKLGRIVVYPNAPAARLGFEDILRRGPLERKPSSSTAPRVRLAPEMENSAASPAELANFEPAVAGNGQAAAPLSGPGAQIPLSFTFDEAEALNRWLLKPAQDGSIAADDPAVHPALMKVRHAVEHAQAIAAVRHELEQAGIPTQHLSDQQVAQLGRRISQAAPRLTTVQP